MALRWVDIHTQQHIYCGDIVIFVPDDLANEIGGRWIMHNNLSTLNNIQQESVI